MKSWSCRSCAFIPILLRGFPPLRRGENWPPERNEGIAEPAIRLDRSTPTFHHLSPGLSSASLALLLGREHVGRQISEGMA